MVGRQRYGTHTESGTDSGGQALNVWAAPPEAIAGGAPLVLWCHPYTQTHGLSPSYFAWPLIHAVVQEGWMAAASNLHGDNWGNNNAQTDILNTYNYVATNYATPSGVIIVGASMGALTAANAIAKNTLPAGKLKGVLSLDGVLDLQWAYSATANGSANAFQSSINTAYGLTTGTLSAASSIGATSISTSVSYAAGTQLLLEPGANQEVVTVAAGGPTGSGPYTIPLTAAATKAHASGVAVSDHPTKTSGNNPMAYAAAAYGTMPWRFYTSTADSQVAPANNAVAMQSKVAATAAESGIITHNNTGHISQQTIQPADEIAYFKRCLAR